VNPPEGPYTEMVVDNETHLLPAYLLYFKPPVDHDEPEEILSREEEKQEVLERVEVPKIMEIEVPKVVAEENRINKRVTVNRDKNLEAQFTEILKDRGDKRSPREIAGLNLIKVLFNKIEQCHPSKVGLLFEENKCQSEAISQFAEWLQEGAISIEIVWSGFSQDCLVARTNVSNTKRPCTLLWTVTFDEIIESFNTLKVDWVEQKLSAEVKNYEESSSNKLQIENEQLRNLQVQNEQLQDVITNLREELRGRPNLVHDEQGSKERIEDPQIITKLQLENEELRKCFQDQQQINSKLRIEIQQLRNVEIQQNSGTDKETNNKLPVRERVREYEQLSSRDRSLDIHK